MESDYNEERRNDKEIILNLREKVLKNNLS
jgi:hypothetical protein